MRSTILYSIVIASQSIAPILAGFSDQLPPKPQPNDIPGTVNGCANAILEHDLDGDGAIRRNEYRQFVNNVADLLCIPPRPELDLELQTVFVSIACLCQELPGNDASCCFGENAGLFDGGASQVAGRTAEQTSYLRAACLLTQAILGPEQCKLPPATLAPGAVTAPFFVTPAPPIPPAGPNNLLWLLLLLLLPLLCCICCCCWRKDKEVEEEYEVTVKEETIVQGPEDPIEDRNIPPQPEDDIEQGLAPPVDTPTNDEGINPMPMPLLAEPRELHDEPPLQDSPPEPAPLPMEPEEPMEPFSAGDEDGGDDNAPKPGVPIPPMGAPGMGEAEDDEEDEENIGRKLGANPDDDEEEDGGRRFGGQGMLPNPPGAEGVVLRHVEREPNEKGEYEYPERNIQEFKYKTEDEGQVLDHYVPDGGVYDPQRPPREPVIMPTPKYERKPPPEPVFIDPRKQRLQMALGDGEVWDALGDWEEEEEKHGNVEKIDWVIHSALTVFAGAEETGDLEKEASSEEDVSDDEEGDEEGA
ncbi:expressed unknown protein [Seminavis robusta]|uniref:EF-hand domain-containing protein n=1 Tax=Seminavis robusta TaxID=568900 RepID=A0A9N8ENJ1_9STRA|nr:expressed unknown protein [Seminavis robusta]|eukprot:Sro1533_g280380.1 n/a (527) ;mRNA; f:18564-20242